MSMVPGGVGGCGGGGAPLLMHKSAAAIYNRSLSRKDDELRSFRYCLRWLFIDQSSFWRSVASWLVFLLLAVVVPAVSHFVLSYNPHRRPYDVVVQASLTSASALSFVCLSSFLRRLGLRRLLYLDKLVHESDRVRCGYTAQLARSLRILSCFALPCSAADAAYKLWWYGAGAGRIPFLGNAIASDAAACALELASWIYRTGTFFLACVLFRLICCLQILRLQDFAAVFEVESEVEGVLRQHLRIRRQLKVISHRFRVFIVCSIAIVTVSQFAALLLTTRSSSKVNIFNDGELALCSIGLVTGLSICLRSAAKITHQAQAITSHAAKWHVCATIESFETDPETPVQNSTRIYPLNSDTDEDVPDEDALDNTKLVQPSANTFSFQKRQALVTYLENNRAGITVFGFVLDRAYLHTILMLQLTLVLWLLGKTIGIS